MLTWLFEHQVMLVALLAWFGVAGLGGAATKIDAWYYNLDKPRWNPPNWAFPVAWTTLFILIAIATARTWTSYSGDTRALIIGLFVLNGVLNAIWSFLFFTFKRPDWAQIEVAALWLSIVALIVALWPATPGAALLLVPYLIWVGYAAVLNRAIVRRNGPFTAAAQSSAGG